MYPNIDLFGIQISTYALCTIAGLIFSAGTIYFMCRNEKERRIDILNMLIYIIIGAVIGARLLFVVTVFDKIWIPEELFLANLIRLGEVTIFTGGLIFYGGLLGGLLAACIFTWVRKLPTIEILEYVVPIVPLFHFFGRIGCFFAGCCYGIEVGAPWGIAYSHSIAAPNGIPFLQTQLIEAFLNVIFFIILLLFRKNKKQWGNGRIIGIYLMMYALARFVLEFFRGDIGRGIFSGLSTSQWISIAILPFGILLLCGVGQFVKNKKNQGK